MVEDTVTLTVELAILISDLVGQSRVAGGALPEVCMEETVAVGAAPSGSPMGVLLAE